MTNEKLRMTHYRGDYFEYLFKITNSDNVSIKLSDDDNIIFTMKSHIGNEDHILQKSLGNGISWDEEKGCYIIAFEHSDTKDLQITDKKDYVFDITIIYDGDKPETHIGIITLLADVTRNEVM